MLNVSIQDLILGEGVDGGVYAWDGEAEGWVESVGGGVGGARAGGVDAVGN